MRLLIERMLVMLLFVAVSRTVRGEDFDSAGVKIHYTVQGQGQPVVLIHGLYSSAKMNWEMPGVTELLAKNYQVIALDERGHGASDKPTAPGSYGTNMVEDVVRLLDHLKIQKAAVVGYSMGGMIAMKLVTSHPDRVQAMVLGGMGWLQTGSALQHYWENLKSRELGATPSICAQEFAKLAVTAEEVKAVKVPVNLVIGEHDPCRRMYVEPLELARPDWAVHVIANAGHINCVTRPEFKEEVKAALDRSLPGGH